MSNNSDDQKKDPLRSGDPKRPHATLDLKAVEIKSAEQRAADAKTTASSTASAAGSKTETSKTDPKTDAVKPGTSAASAGAAGTTGSSKSETGKGETGKGTSPTDAAFKSKSKPPPRDMPPLERKSGGGFGRFVSHTLAGIVGGFLALLGADTLAPQLGQLGLPVGSSQQANEQLGQRIAALEVQSQKSATQSGDSAKLTAALDGVSQRVAELEKLKGQVAQLSEAQAQLKSEADALAKQLAEAPGGSASAAPDPRIAKLEERLALLSQASGDGQASGAVPELAAVTGKIADLEATMANQIDALRKSVGAEIDTRMGKAAEAAEAARSGTQRIDRELADVKTEATRFGQRMETLKADNERVSETLRVVQEETGKLASGLDALKGDMAAKFKAAAKPEDVAQAIAPVTAKVATLEKNVAGVVTAEENRKANAERIVLSLELANLKRVIDRGLGYAEELAQVKKAADGKVDLKALEPYKSSGVRTLPELREDFRPLTHRMIAAAEDTGDAGVFDRLVSGAKSVVRVRKVKHSADDDSIEAVVARMDTALEEGRVGDFQTLADKLPEKARAPAADLLKQVAARAAVDKALKDIESQLKTSLGAGGPAPAAPVIQ
jgi:hypothetical protein